MSFLAWMKRVPSKLREIGRTSDQIRELRDLLLFSQTKQLQLQHANPLNRFGRKCFSQSDEDGITLEILRRIGQANPAFSRRSALETERGTTRGSLPPWLEGILGRGRKLEVRSGRPQPAPLLPSPRLDHAGQYRNAHRARAARDRRHWPGSDFADLDGNDIYFVEKILSAGFRPKVFIVEYRCFRGREIPDRV